MELPIFAGEGNEVEPFAYLEELKKLCEERQISESDLLNYVLPRS